MASVKLKVGQAQLRKEKNRVTTQLILPRERHMNLAVYFSARMIVEQTFASRERRLNLALIRR